MPSMDETSITSLPCHQPHQAHEPPSHPKTSPSPPESPSTQPNNMDCTTSPIHSSSPHSPSSAESVLSISPSPPSIYPSYLSRYLVPSHPSARAGKKFARRFPKRLARLEARLTPSEIIARAQKKFERERMSECEISLVKRSCVKGELKRAKRIAISLRAFQILDIHYDGDEEDSACEQVIITQDSEIGAEIKVTKTETFAGVITIQDRLSAIRQALSEHAKDGTLRKEPGRHSFHVDAAVSAENELTGIAVVHKTDRWSWPSLWTTKAYRIREALDQTDAEAWAISQALQVTLEKVHADRAKVKPQDPCSLSVVYSDCKGALQMMGDARSAGKKVAQKIITQSMELKRLGVAVHLHWVPGHRSIPGNELADLVAKKARQPLQ